ncbi:MAG TPA: hypothetical protein PKE21_17460 [Flavobacteriales bacterium]|nr:hypothetical protein [Flavobacteriales bacterium]HMR29269.1 hypothetical protein [Flavobacteriales bacterium]
MKPILTLCLLCVASAGTAQTLSLAPIFGSGGIITADVAVEEDNLKSHALLPDGRLIVAGDGYDLGTNSYHITMVAIDPACGAFDQDFGTAGKLSHMFEQRTRCYGIAAQPDGKIVGCGMIAPNNFGSEQWPAVYRFHGDGSVDTSFNHTGYHRLQLGTGAADLNKVFVNADGTITCAAASFPGQLGAMRFLENGALDTTFNHTGVTSVQLPNFSQSSEGTGVMLPDGSVVSIVVGFSGIDYMLMLAKFDAQGAPDTTFGNNGLVVGTVPVRSFGRMGAAVEPGGAIVVSCSRTTASITVVARFLSDGSVDPSFGTSGYSEIDASAGGDGLGNGLLLLPDGSSLQFGRVSSIGGLVKRDANGQPVATFGSGGLLGVNAGLPGFQVFMSGALMPDGRIIAYGDANTNEVYIAKLTEDPVADGPPVISLIGTDLTTTGSGAIQWFLDGLPIGGATSSSYTPTANGTYTVTLTLSPSCAFTSDPFNLINLGTMDHGTNTVQLLDNPVTDVLVVLNAGPMTWYEITSVAGHRIGSGVLQGERTEIGMAHLAKGVYLLRTGTTHGSTVARIIKQ